MFKQVKGYWINTKRITFATVKPSQEVFSYSSPDFELIVSFQNYADCLYISFPNKTEADQALHDLITD